MLKSVLIHLSRNMWSDQPGSFTDYLVFDEKIWQDLLRRCPEVTYCGTDEVMTGILL